MFMFTDDTYNIPCVTDCTRELNEWVYSGVRGRDKLFSTPPELSWSDGSLKTSTCVCMFSLMSPCMESLAQLSVKVSVHSTHYFFYMCIGIVSTVPKPMESKDAVIEELKQEITSLQKKNRNLQQKIEIDQAEHSQLLEAELQQYNERERTTSQEMAEKEEQILHQRREKQQLERQKQYFQQQAQDMQRRLEVAESQSKFSKLQIPRLDQDSWNVRRQEVVLQDNLGHGAWGSVCRGLFRGQQVAVKSAHEKILHKHD